MPSPQQRLQTAMQYALSHRPEVGGFPYLAECLRLAGVTQNVWSLPSAQSIYILNDGVVVHQGASLVSGIHDVPNFNEEALITAIRKDQAGQSTFPEFLSATYTAGVTKYDVDFTLRTVTYYGARGECYTESYPPIELGEIRF